MGGELTRVKADRCAEGCALSHGPTLRSDGSCQFLVWAPCHKSVKLRLFSVKDSVARKPIAEPHDRADDQIIEMTRNEFGYFRAVVNKVDRDSRYMYQLESPGSGAKELPDPASRYQPEGVHGASQLVDLADFSWGDDGWKAPALERSAFYELHIGTYTRAGTLDALVKRLPRLVDLGVTTVELMPVAQFPGARNWGYDGVYPYAVQNSYGGPRALQRFVNAAHRCGLAVALDVIYNHLGPEGNYLAEFGPYFTQKYKTPWGQAINFDGAESEPVRRYFIDNAVYWFENFHVDVLRLDAIHGIYDFSALHILQEWQARVEDAAERLGRKLMLVAESDLNDVRVLRPREQGGYGIEAQWNDDFHHSVHTLLTKESQGYYADFGQVADLAAVLRDGWLYQGQYSRFRKRRHGNSAREISKSRLVVCNQNHDQVGNRARGERLSQLVSFEALKLAAGLTLLSPFVPLLFMGEEYGETVPFLYFTDHGDQSLIEAVRNGRRAEFAEFGWDQDVPDPQDPGTFEKSRLLKLDDREPHRTLRGLYQELMRLRRQQEWGASAQWVITEDEKRKTLTMIRRRNGVTIAMIFNFGEESVQEVLPQVRSSSGAASNSWTAALCSSDGKWLGPGTAREGQDSKFGTISLPAQSFIVLRDDRER